MAGTDPRGYETRDISARHAGGLVLAILGCVLGALLAMGLLFTYFSRREKSAQPPPLSEVPAQGNPQPPEPRLQMNPVQDYRKQRAETEVLLTTYGWVDRSAGKVRIPVSRAIDLLAERGLPR